MTRALPIDPIGIANELRHKLDAAELRNAELARANEELQRQVEDLQRVLIGTAGDLIEEGRGDAFWAMAAHSANLRTVRHKLRVIKVERWLRESGVEASKLQADLDVARNAIGQLTRQLELARTGECECMEVD